MYVPVSMCTWVLSEFVCTLCCVPVSVQLFARVCMCVCLCVCVCVSEGRAIGSGYL